MTRGNFFTTEVQQAWGISHNIRLRVEKFPEPRLVTAGSIGISSWQDAADRDLYFSLWTDEELTTLERLEYEMWAASPKLGTKSLRWKLSNQIEKLQSTVQKRGGKQLRDS